LPVDTSLLEKRPIVIGSLLSSFSQRQPEIKRAEKIKKTAEINLI